MPRRKIDCGECGQPMEAYEPGMTAHKKCDGTARSSGGPRFEPQADPGTEWIGRPYADPRNNFRFPNYNYGVPKRDLAVSPIRVAVWDTESTGSGFNGSFARMLCSVIQMFSPDEMRIRRADEYEPWKRGARSDDSELVRAILKDLEDADVVIAHNGARWDLPLIRTRGAILGLPPVHPKKLWDPCQTARREFRFVSNRLDAINRDLKTRNQKTDIDPDIWACAAMDSDDRGREAFQYIVEHCIADVLSLCETAQKLAPYVRQIDSIGSFRQ